MLYYYKYDFISPESLYAEIKEELSSYFESGAIDDMMFPLWTEKCLKKLGKTSYTPKEVVLNIDNSMAILPDDFHKVREAWVCNPLEKEVFLPSTAVTYKQCKQKATLLGDDKPDRCKTCDDYPKSVEVTYKYEGDTSVTYFGASYLLSPGTISTKKHCTSNCANIYSTSLDTFDIHGGNRFVTNFRNGNVLLIYYAKEYDKEGYQLVPDDYDILHYIESYIKWKLRERLLDQTTDESFRIAQYKAEKAEREKNFSWISARTSSMRETIKRKQLEKSRQHRANWPYEIR